jgi:hypothetical protein
VAKPCIVLIRFPSHPAVLRCQVREAAVDTRFVRPMVADFGIVLRLAANRDRIRLVPLKNGLRLVRLKAKIDMEN